MKKSILTASLVLAISFTTSCITDAEEEEDNLISKEGLSSSDNPSSSSEAVKTPSSGSSGGTDGKSGTYTDSRDGKSYKWVKIGDQIWLAENLHFAAPGSKCGDSDAGVLVEGNTSACNTYGRLYDWATAITVCPDGWHLSDEQEWLTLGDFVGLIGSTTRLKADSDLWTYGKGTDDYGFSALPGGFGSPTGDFKQKDLNVAQFWCSNDYDEKAGYLSISGINYIEWEVHEKTYYYSVRCVKN